MALEGREKSPEKGVRHSGRFRWPFVPRRAVQGALWHCRAVLTFGWRRGRLKVYYNHKAKLQMCTSILHVDIWSWVIGHGELESGVYLF